MTKIVRMATPLTDAESPPNTPNAEAAQADGRRAWRDRNRVAVVDALLDFYAEGNLRPGAQAVAERSGVSRRSVFRYFDNLDDLDRTAIARQHERVRHLVELPGIGDGSLTERIERIAAQRVTLFAAIAPAARVTRIRAPFQPVLAEELAVSRKLLGRQVERHFRAELDALPAASRVEILAAADVACSFETFDQLLATRGLAPAEIGGVMTRMLLALFEPCR